MSLRDQLGAPESRPRKPKSESGLSTAQWVREHYDEIAALRSEGYSWKQLAKVIGSELDRVCAQHGGCWKCPDDDLYGKTRNAHPWAGENGQVTIEAVFSAERRIRDRIAEAIAQAQH
jgi:hypothetical protein